MSIHAIEPTRPRVQSRVDAVESPRHRADAATEARRVDGAGRPKFNSTQATAWGHVLPGERPVSPERINAMEHVLLNAVGFDLYVPQDQYEDCVAELCGVVRSHAAATPSLPVLLQRHAQFLATQAAHLPWTTPPQRVSLSTRRRRFQ